MGMTIAFELLLAIYPFKVSAEALRHDLMSLESSRFLVSDGSPPVWCFAQVQFPLRCP